MSRILPLRLLALLLCLSSPFLFAQNPNSGDNRPCQENARISLAFSGDTVRGTCIDDDVMDRLRFQVQPFRQAFAYVVVDANDVIQSVGFSNFINFDMLPGGELRVYAFSNYGELLVEVGDAFTGATLSLPCAGLTQNFVTINNGMTGDITIESDQDSYDVCVGDGTPDFINVSTDAADANTVYVVTDDGGNVLNVSDTGSINFDGAGSGVCRVYALAGGFTIAAGENISTLDGVGGCGSGLSNNFITVNRAVVFGGVITTPDGETTVEICPGDGNADVVDFTIDNVEGENTAVLITDENNVVVMIPTGRSVDFDDTPVGVCRAWSIAYNGDVEVLLGQQINTVIENNDCISVSANFVQVTRLLPDGGTVATTTGLTEVQTCPGDGVDDVIDVVVSGNEGGELVYLLTDADNLILDFSDEPRFNLEGAPVGTCRIWAVAFRGNLSFTPGDDAGAVALSDNCFDLSDNFVTVVRAVPSGGTVATEAGETEVMTCPGDGANDFLSFVLTGADASNFTFVVTEADGTILNFTNGEMVNFESAGLGTCRVYGLAYEGELNTAVGGNIANRLATECFGLSDNFVTVVREFPEGGTVRLANGATEVSVCPGDGIADVLTITSTGATGELFDYVITDTSGLILGFPASGNIDFETIPAGICRVYGLAYSGTIVANVGDQFFAAPLATACSTVSDNFVTVNRIEATTGPVSLQGGGDEILVCPGDATPNPVRFDSAGTSLSNFNYLVTNEDNIIIAAVPFTDEIDFENFAAGTCRVYGIGYDGIITAAIGQTVGEDQLATGCSAVSENFVTVTKQIPDGGTLTTLEGDSEVMVCSMDGIADLVTAVSSSTSGARFFFVLTTEDNDIINIQDEALFDFDVAPFGVCRIWGLSFQGMLLVGPGDNLTEDVLAEGCADLSDNFITVIREDAAVGNISFTDGPDTVFTCPGDGIADVLDFTVDGSSSGVIYLITTDQDTLLTTAGDGSFDFEGAGTGTCRIYALSFAGSLLAGEGIEVTTADLATGCFALSDNYLTVVRENPDGATVSLPDGSNEVSFCSGDGTPDILNFTTTSDFPSYGYIIADEGIALTGITTDSFDLSNALTGMLEIYGVAYTGNLTVAPGSNIFESDLSTDCYDLSDDFITVNVVRVDPGEITGNGSTEVFLCPENLDDGLVEFETNSAMFGANYVYVVTFANDDNVVLDIVDGTSFDFGPVPLMELRVYAVCYTGDLQIVPGQTSLTNDVLSSGCFGLSNAITVFNDGPEAGEVSVDGLSSTGVACVVDGETDISVATTSTSLAGYAVIVTDTDSIIQSISTTPEAVPFGTLPEGDYLLFGLSYTGNVIAQVGDDVTVAVLADNCYELTPDFINITRGGAISAGTLSNATNDQSDTITFCLADGTLPIAIVETDMGSINYRYIVTDTDDRVLAANLPSNIIPFTAFQPGEYRIYGFNFTGAPSVGINQILIDAVLSTECYALSNFITVVLNDPDAGSVFAVDTEGDVTIEIIGTPEAPEAFVTFGNTAPGPDTFTYLITDENNLVLGTSDDPTINFGPAGVGVCRVWGLSYVGELTAAVGADAAVAELATACFTLSDGFVTVTRTDDDGLVTPGNAADGVTGYGAEGNSAAASTSLSAFPNPSATGEVFIIIDSDAMLPQGQLMVRDMNGQTHRVEVINGGGASTTVRFDVNDLAPGMYFVSYVTAQGIESLQFMKQ